MYAKVFISLHCYSYSLLSWFWIFVNYISEKYHCVALLLILFRNDIEKILPYLKTFSFLFLWNFHVIFHFYAGLLSLFLFYLFENNVFIFWSLLLYFFAQQEWKLVAAHKAEFFSSFYPLPHRLSSSCKYGLTVCFHIYSFLWCSFLVTNPAHVAPVTSHAPSSLGSNQEITDLVINLYHSMRESSVSVDFYF